MEVQTTTTTEVKEKSPSSWRDGQVFQSLEALRPWLQWLMIGVMALGGLYLYQRDTNAQQNIGLAELQRKQDILQKTMDERKTSRDKEIDNLRDKIVTKDLFEERSRSVDQRFDRMEEMSKEILDRLPIRNP